MRQAMSFSGRGKGAAGKIAERLLTVRAVIGIYLGFVNDGL